MKPLNIWKQGDNEPQHYVRTRQHEKHIELQLVDATGSFLSRLLGVDRLTGRVTFFTGIDEDYGFDLGDDGRLKVAVPD